MHLVKKDYLEGKIDSFLLPEGDDDRYEVDFDNSIHLTHNRLDVAFKLLYIKLRERNRTLAEEIYSSHIRAFSFGEYIEKGSDKKANKQDFIAYFDELLDDMSINGFDEKKSLIPLAVDGSLINGAHRYSVIHSQNTKAGFVKLNIQPSNYNYDFFRTRGVNEDWIEFAVSQFIESTDNTYMGILWPSAIGEQDKVEKILGNLVYKKKIKLTKQGAHNLLSIVYKGEPWLGEEKDNYPGIPGKLLHCFRNSYFITVYVFQDSSLECVLNKKDKIRDIYKLGKHSIHITDNQIESIELAQTLLNQNSIDFINKGSPNRFHTNKNNIFSVLNKYSNKYDMAVEGGSVLSLYGLREGNDIDVIHSGKMVIIDDKVDNHNLHFQYHSQSIQDLIYDPSNFFYFNGVKFISLNRLKEFKVNRNEGKDTIDVELIKSLTTSNYSSKVKKIKADIYFSKAKYKRKLKSKVRTFLIKIGVFDELKKLLKKS